MRGMDLIKAAAEYEAGDTLEILADRYGLSPGTVRTRLRGAGVTFRPTGPQRSTTATRVRVTAVLPARAE